MRKRILLLFFIVINYNLLIAQVEYNRTGMLGLGYKINYAGLPVVDNALPGSPAHLAGAHRGDYIMKINGQSLEGITMEVLAEKLKVNPGQTIKINLEDDEKKQKEIVIKKAAFFSATYNESKYIIFFDENGKTLSNPDEPCVWGYGSGCYHGTGYYVYSPTEAFYGVFEDGNRKEGLYYYSENGKPYYYLGAFSDNHYTGKGILTYPDEKNVTMLYTGDFLNGELEGAGTIENMNDGHIFTGTFKAGSKEGYGKETDANGVVVAEGQWKNGVFQEATNTIQEDWSGLSEEEIINKAEKLLVAEKKADSTERANIQAQLNEYYAKQKAAAVVEQTNPGTSSSAIDLVAESLKMNNDSRGRSLSESFDVGISKYQTGTCFTGCSEYMRYIYVLVEEGVPGFDMTKLFVNSMPQRGDLPPNIPPREDPKNYFDWGNLGNVNGIQIFYQGINISEIHSACSYEWQLFSTDEQKHYAKILVFGGK